MGGDRAHLGWGFQRACSGRAGDQWLGEEKRSRWCLGCRLDASVVRVVCRCLHEDT